VTELMNPTILARSVDDRMPVIDRVRVQLLSYNEQEVHFNLDDFAAAIRIGTLSAYQALHRLEQKKEIELIKEQIRDTKRERIAGARLQKMESAQEILARAKNNSKPTHRVVREITRATNSNDVPMIKEYMKKKAMLEKIESDLTTMGFDPKSVLVLPVENQMAEEAVHIYGKWLKDQETIVELQQQIELLRRENAVLSGSKVFHAPDGHNAGKGAVEEVAANV